MKRSMIVIIMLLKIAFAGYSQTDTICLPVDAAIKKIKQADSLVVAKEQIKEQKNNISILEQRISEKDTTIQGLKQINLLAKEKIESKDREIIKLNDKFNIADERGNILNKKLKRANTRAIFGTIIGAAIPIIITIIKK